MVQPELQISEGIPEEKFKAYVAMTNASIHELSLYKCERAGGKPIELIWYSIDCRMRMLPEIPTLGYLAKLRWRLTFELLAFEAACREAFARSPDLAKQTVWVAVDPYELGQNVAYETYCQSRIDKTQSAIAKLFDVLFNRVERRTANGDNEVRRRP
jgi:hypothetical protein